MIRSVGAHSVGVPPCEVTLITLLTDIHRTNWGGKWLQGGQSLGDCTPEGICVYTVGPGGWAQQGRDLCLGTVTQWVPSVLGGVKRGVAGPRVSHHFPYWPRSRGAQQLGGET